MNTANFIQIMYLKKIGVCDNNIYERLSNAWDRYTLLKGERDMLKINQEKCKKCQICAKNCPIGAIAVVESYFPVTNSYDAWYHGECDQG